MKLMRSLWVITILVTVISCEFNDEPQIKGEYSFVITGMKESITYVFHTGSERVANTPDEVKNLTVLIVDELEDIVFETRFCEWDPSGAIPDSIFIPSLPAGEYKIYAMTLDYYNHWYEDGIFRTDSTDTNPDTVITDGKVIIEPYVVNQGPIYVGIKPFTLMEDKQHVVIKMENISAKITLASTQNIHGWLDTGIKSKAGVYFDFATGTFIESGYDNFLYMYMDDSTQNKNFYILPQTLMNLDINFYTYTDNYQTYSPSITFDPYVSMNVGDAITFKLDIDAIMEGSGSGVFEWEDIAWNDLGEISIP